MKRIYVFMFLFIGTGIVIFAENSNLLKLNIYGNVIVRNSITYTEYKNGSKVIQSSEIYRFNKMGFFTETLYKNSKNEIWSWTKFNYDKQNRIIEEIEFDGSGIVKEKYTYNYSLKDDGKTIELTILDSSNSLYQRIINTYNKSLLINSKKFDDQNQIVYDISFTYDSNGKLLEEIEKSEYNNHRTKYLRNTIGEEIASENFDADNIQTSRADYLLNQNGRRVGLVFTDLTKNQKIQSDYLLDSFGNIIKVVSKRDTGVRITEFTYQYQ